MTILQLAPRMPYPLTDGGAIGIFNITKSLAELGHEITLVTFPLDDAEETREAVAAISKYAKVEMVSKPLPARWKVLARTVLQGAYPIERRMMPEMFELLQGILERQRFDVVHVDHAHMGKYGLWIKREYGLPIVLREHNFESLIYERFARTGAESHEADRGAHAWSPFETRGDYFPKKLRRYFSYNGRRCEDDARISSAREYSCHSRRS